MIETWHLKNIVIFFQNSFVIFLFKQNGSNGSIQYFDIFCQVFSWSSTPLWCAIFKIRFQKSNKYIFKGFFWPKFSNFSQHTNPSIRLFQIVLRGWGNRNFTEEEGGFFYRVKGTWTGVILTIPTFFKAKNSFFWILNIN